MKKVGGVLGLRHDLCLPPPQLVSMTYWRVHGRLVRRAGDALVGGSEIAGAFGSHTWLVQIARGLVRLGRELVHRRSHNALND
jgi:hypothetical protein